MLGQGEPQAGARRRGAPGERGPGRRVGAPMAAVAPSQLRAPGLARRALRSDHLAGWLFVLPAVALIALFSIFPIIWGFVLSLQKASLISPNRPFIGFDNYADIASDPRRGAGGGQLRLLHVPVRADVDRDLDVPRDRAQPEDPADPLLPPGGLHPGRGLDDRDRRDVPVGVRRELRHRELGARPGRDSGRSGGSTRRRARCPRSRS